MTSPAHAQPSQHDERPVASGLRLGPIRHLAFVVSNLEDEARRLGALLAVGPWLVSDFTLPGDEPCVHLSTAYTQWGDVQLELIEQHNDVASCFRGWLQPGESSRLHHLCTHTAALDADLRQVTAAGGQVEFSFGLDPASEARPSRFAIVRSPLAGDLYHELTQPGTFVDAQTDAVRAAARDWDGTEVLRPMPALLAARDSTQPA
jgi:hypothetical protein